MPATIEPPRRPLFYHGWTVVSACVLSQVAVLALTFNCFSLFLVDWTREFDVPVSTVALSVSMFSFGCMLTAPLFGIAADRFPARWVFGLALVGAGAVHALVGFASTAWQVVAIYGILLPLVIAPASSIQGQALVSRWFERRRGLAMGLTAFGAALAGVIFPPVIVWLLPEIGWRGVWWMGGFLIACVAAPLVVLAARDRPWPEERGPYVTVEVKTHVAATLSFRDIIRRRNFWVTIGTFLSAQVAFTAVSVNMAPFTLANGHGPGLAALLMSVLNIAALGAKLGAGMLSDRLGNRGPLVLMALLCAGGVVILALGSHDIALLTLGVVLVGTAGAGWTLLASSTAAEFGSENFGRAFGLISALTPINMLAPPVFALMNESSGSYLSGFVVLGVIAIGGALLGTRLAQTRMQAEPQIPDSPPLDSSKRMAFLAIPKAEER
ncbi:MAG: MFS transporter [Sphingobium sp.]